MIFFRSVYVTNNVQYEVSNIGPSAWCEEYNEWQYETDGKYSECCHCKLRREGWKERKINGSSSRYLVINFFSEKEDSYFDIIKGFKVQSVDKWVRWNRGGTHGEGCWYFRHKIKEKKQKEYWWTFPLVERNRILGWVTSMKKGTKNERSTKNCKIPVSSNLKLGRWKFTASLFFIIIFIPVPLLLSLFRCLPSFFFIFSPSTLHTFPG